MYLLWGVGGGGAFRYLFSEWRKVSRLDPDVLYCLTAIDSFYDQDIQVINFVSSAKPKEKCLCL